MMQENLSLCLVWKCQNEKAPKGALFLILNIEQIMRLTIKRLGDLR